MANSKVQLANGTVLIDLTGDTVEASVLRSGYTAHDASGQAVTGTLNVAHIYIGSAAPSGSLGNNGDIYIKTGA